MRSLKGCFHYHGAPEPAGPALRHGFTATLETKGTDFSAGNAELHPSSAGGSAAEKGFQLRKMFVFIPDIGFLTPWES